MTDAPKRGRGRPPLAPGESRARTSELRVRASRAELERWAAAAGGAGKLSEWVRERLDEAAEQETRSTTPAR